MADGAITYPEYFKSFKFAVSIEDASGKQQVASFSTFSGIKMHVDILSSRGGDDPRGTYGKDPGLTSFENVTLSKGTVGDYEFLEWMLSVAPSDIAAPTGKKMRRTIIVTALDAQNHPGIEWKLIDCLPAGYTLEPLDADKSDYLMETIELAIEGFTRTTKPLPT